MGICELMRIRRDYDQIVTSDSHELFEESVNVDLCLLNAIYEVFGYPKCFAPKLERRCCLCYTFHGHKFRERRTMYAEESNSPQSV